MIIDFLSYALMGLGIVFWFWGTSHLVGDRSVLFKLHSLSVADTLGSIAIILGLMVKIPSKLPLLILALLSLALWNTMLGYVIAYCATDGGDIDIASMQEDFNLDINSDPINQRSIGEGNYE